MMKKRPSVLIPPILLLTSLFLSSASAQDQRRGADSRPARIAALLRAYTDLEQLSGAILVAEKGKILFRGAFGFSDRELRAPASPDHRFLIGEAVSL